MDKMHALGTAFAGALFLGLAATSQATLRYWDTDGNNPGLGGGGPSDWVLGNLWNTDPTGGGAGTLGGWAWDDDAYFNGNGISTVSVSTPITTGNFHIGDGIANGTAVTLNLVGSGEIFVMSSISIGASSVGAGSATLTLGGSVTNQAYWVGTNYQTDYIGNSGCAGTLNLTGSNAFFGACMMSIGNNGAPGSVNVVNGELYSWGNVILGQSANATLSVSSNGAVVFNSVTLCGSSGANATINLNGGRTVFGTLAKTVADSNTKAILNLNGGVMAAGKNSNPFMTNLDAVNVLGGGAIIDTTNFNIYIQQAFLNGGTGGGLTKLGAGNLLLYGTNSYTGATTVSNGTLYLEYNGAYGRNAEISNSASINILAGAAVNVSGRTDNTLPVLPAQLLTGAGSITGNLAAQGTVAPGGGPAGNIGKLNASGAISLGGTTWMNLNRTNGANCDQLTSSQNITYGGTLVVSNVGPALIQGDTFYLFNALAGYNSSFSNIVLPGLTGTNVWYTNNLAVNGSISVNNPPPAPGIPSWTPKYVGTTVNGQVAPLGYYEYLPSGYNAVPQNQSNYPVVIFMHGSGQYGDGTATGSPGLANNLTDGLCKLIQNNTYPVAQAGGIFDVSNVVVLCPQCTVFLADRRCNMAEVL